MGTMIELALNKVEIDWGKNRSFINHYWLFPPDSLHQIVYPYRDEGENMDPGFQAKFRDVIFRMNNLGYSLAETRLSYEELLSRWNRTGDLNLPFSDLLRIMESVDFSQLPTEFGKKYQYDFDQYLQDVISHDESIMENNAKDEYFEYAVEDFIKEGLDFNILLRLYGENPENLDFHLEWFTQDLIDSGWTTMQDIRDINSRDLAAQFTGLYPRVMDQSGAKTDTNFNQWLRKQGIPCTTMYVRQTKNGQTTTELLSLPVAVRHMIHHPENQHNTLSKDQIGESVELLLTLISGES
ncbi:MAG: HEPN/Toprim-associated domain-containing protein [Bifidobacterium crudilactis]|jgi:hypothetical protein|nr:HEPN/Toprim-associated domain-containing protein [Bifidobacterium crudilactis]